MGLSVFFQAAWLVLLFVKLNHLSTWISLFTSIFSLSVVLRLYSKHTTAAMKMPWIMLILAFPVMGLSLYLLIEVFGDLGSNGKRLRSAREKTERFLTQEEAVLAQMEETGRTAVLRTWQCILRLFAPLM